jgi:hypothetical protein
MEARLLSDQLAKIAQLKADGKDIMEAEQALGLFEAVTCAPTASGDDECCRFLEDMIDCNEMCQAKRCH